MFLKNLLFFLALFISTSNLLFSASAGGGGRPNLSSVDYALVQYIRTHAEQHPADYDMRGCAALRPVAERLLGYLKTNALRDAAWFEAYLSVTPHPVPIVLLAVAMRTAQEKLTEDEKEIFSHIPNWESLERIVDAETVELFTAALHAYPSTQKSSYPSGHGPAVCVGARVQRDISHFLHCRLDPIPYIMLNRSKLPIKEFIALMLNGIAPVCLPKAGSANSAHGATLTPFGFSLHDLFHAHDESNVASLVQHVIQEVSTFVDKGGDALPFAQSYQKHALGRHALQTEFFKDFLKAVDLRAPAQQKKILAGWFLVLHEYPLSSRAVFDTHSLKDAIVLMAEYSQARLASDRGWESFVDPMKTDHTGQSLLEEFEILEIGLADFKKSLSVLPPNYDAASTDKKAELLQSLVAESRIENKGRFLDVHIRMRSGERKIFSYPTLLHKIKNMSDSVAILKYAGIECPKIEDITSRGQALEALQVIRKQLASLIDEFKGAAMTHAEGDWQHKYAEYCEQT